MNTFTSNLPKDKVLKASTEDEFIQSVAKNQVTVEQFYSWLSQDYLCGLAYFRMVAQALIVAPRADYKVFAETLAEIAEEFTWTEKKMKDKGIIAADIKPEANASAYQVWIDELIKSNPTYLTLGTAIYANDICCYEKWKPVKNREYREFISRWCSRDFAQAIADLRMSIDKASANYSEEEKQEARKIWDTVVAFRTGL